MPQMEDIIVKKADGLTDFVYKQVSAAPGDGGFAQWEGPGVSRSVRATFRVSTRWNKSKTAREVNVSGMYPSLKTVDGVAQIGHLIPLSAYFAVPSGFLETDLPDAVAVLTNSLASALMKSVLETGIAPT